MMDDMPFIPDYWDLIGKPRPYPWVPVAISPPAGGVYLVVLGGSSRAWMAHFKAPGWMCLYTSKEFKTVTYWAELPHVPKDNYE